MTRKRIRAEELETLPATEFKRIRQGLGFSQAELQRVLGYGHVMRVSELEREKNPVPVPWLVGQLMKAMAEGYRPETWIENDPFA
jgi:transcriptional regulator with XRE-family HTH domain